MLFQKKILNRYKTEEGIMENVYFIEYLNIISKFSYM